MNTQIKNKPASKLMERLRQHLNGNAPALLPHCSRSLHITCSLKSRLSLAVNILHSSIAESQQSSGGKNHLLKPVVILFRQRVIESNQFDNLSPPLAPAAMILLKHN